jgi:hypothetical protein
MKRFVPFTIGERKIEVMLQKIGKSPIKTLTELITNSDDSYKRLLSCGACKFRYPEKDFHNKVCPKCGEKLLKVPGEILLVYNVRRRLFQVIDHAEGLTDVEMEEKFNEFGEDIAGRTKGTPERGLFKQGLAQVLFTQKYGNVKSIKDGNSYICKYIKESKHRTRKPKRGFDISSGPKVTKELRDAWRIPQGNGTVVEFVLREDINIKKPQPEKLYEKLCNFFMLRKIISDPNRVVKFMVIHRKSQPIEKILRPNTPIEGRLLSEKKLQMTYDNYHPIEIEIELYENRTELVQWEGGIEDREGGLLIFDDKDRIYDLTLFKFDRYPDARKLYGNIRLNGAYEIIKDRLDNYYEEVVLESRDGLNPKHAFYDELCRVLEPWLEPHVKEQRKRKGAEQDSLSEESKKRQAKAFEILNKLYKTLTEEIDIIGPEPGKEELPPENGLEFVRSQIKTTLGKKYGLVLRIDTDIIPMGTEVELSSNNQNIKIQPPNFLLGEKTSRVLSKTIVIFGTKACEVGVVKAVACDKKAEVLVEVVEQDVFKLTDAMAFHPDQVYAYSGRTSFLNLYINTIQIPLGSIIGFTSTNPDIVLECEQTKLDTRSTVGDETAKLVVPFVGHGIGQKGEIRATHINYVARAEVAIISKIEKPPKKSEGKFSGEWRYESLGRDVRTEYDPPTGDIIVNSDHPLNIKYFGQYAKKAYETYLHCQIYLAELIIDECLHLSVGEAQRLGKLKDRIDPATDLRIYIEEQRYKIGDTVHTYFVKPELLPLSTPKANS